MLRPLAPLVPLAFGLALSACGGSVIGEASDGGGDAGDAAPDVFHHAPDSAHDVVVDSGRDTIAMHDTYVDPGCDGTPPPITSFECDPLAVPSKCPPGEACYPYAIPATAPCEPETYTAQCFPAGTGTQGTPCDGAAEGCAPGFFCVVSGVGNICAAGCKAGEPGTCKEGLICEPTDVPGVGACI